MASRSRAPSPPGTVEGGDPNRIFLATLRIRVPKDLWTGRFTTAHPEVRLEVLNRGEVGPGTSISDYWIAGGPPGVWAPEIGQYSDVVRVDSLAQVGSGCLYRVTYQDPPIIGLYRQLKLPIPFPIRIQGGMIDWEVAARYSEFEEVLAFSRSRDPEAKIVSIRHRPLRNHLPSLTDRQQELLSEAMAAGYFAVPRGITLTELARKLHRSKSSVSEAIAIIEQKLLESALRAPLAQA